MNTCPTCKKYVFHSDRHRCAPQWKVWNEWATEDDARTVFAHDAEYAARKFSEDDDARSAEYPAEREVFVRGDGEPIKFAVFLESQPVYSAREVKDKAKQL